MTKYHALVAQLRQRLSRHVDKPQQIDVWDCSSGSLADAWSLAQVLRSQCPQAAGVNLYACCEYGRIPAAPLDWRGEWLSDLPGVQRLYDPDTNLTLTMWVMRGAGSTVTMLQTLLCAADVILVDAFEQLETVALQTDALLLQRSTLALRSVVALKGADPLWSRWAVPAGLSSGASVAVVGAGIAGMSMAYTLAQRGFAVTILDEHDPLGPQGVHWGHHAAALTPVVAADDNLRSRLSRAGALLAARLWRQLPADIGSACGALQLEKAPDQRRRVDLEQLAQSLDLPSWASWLTVEQASERAGIHLTRGALWLPGGWLIRVERLLAALANAQRLTVTVAKAHAVRQQAGQWQVLDVQGDVLVSASALVLANAADAPRLLASSGVLELPVSESAAGWGRLRGMHRLAGEITALPSQILDHGPRCVVGGDGYVLPAIDGWCITGGTYVRGAESATVSLSGKQDNLVRAGQLLGRDDLPQRLSQSGFTLQSLPGWAGWRAVVGGRLPVAGPVVDGANLYICTAGASRGLTWSAMQAQLLADHLQARLPALERSLLGQISLI